MQPLMFVGLLAEADRGGSMLKGFSQIQATSKCRRVKYLSIAGADEYRAAPWNRDGAVGDARA